MRVVPTDVSGVHAVDEKGAGDLEGQVAPALDEAEVSIDVGGIADADEFDGGEGLGRKEGHGAHFLVNKRFQARPTRSRAG